MPFVSEENQSTGPEEEVKKPGYLVFAPIGLIWGGSCIEIALLAKWAGGLDPVCYHRAQIIFWIGITVLGLSIIGTKKLFAKS